MKTKILLAIIAVFSGEILPASDLTLVSTESSAAVSISGAAEGDSRSTQEEDAAQLLQRIWRGRRVRIQQQALNAALENMPLLPRPASITEGVIEIRDSINPLEQKVSGLCAMAKELASHNNIVMLNECLKTLKMLVIESKKGQQKLMELLPCVVHANKRSKESLRLCLDAIDLFCDHVPIAAINALKKSICSSHTSSFAKTKCQELLIHHAEKDKSWAIQALLEICTHYTQVSGDYQDEVLQCLQKVDAIYFFDPELDVYFAFDLAKVAHSFGGVPEIVDLCVELMARMIFKEGAQESAEQVVLTDQWGSYVPVEDGLLEDALEAWIRIIQSSYGHQKRLRRCLGYVERLFKKEGAPLCTRVQGLRNEERAYFINTFGEIASNCLSKDGTIAACTGYIDHIINVATNTDEASFIVRDAMQAWADIAQVHAKDKQLVELCLKKIAEQVAPFMALDELEQDYKNHLLSRLYSDVGCATPYIEVNNKCIMALIAIEGVDRNCARELIDHHRVLMNKDFLELCHGLAGQRRAEGSNAPAAGAQPPHAHKRRRREHEAGQQVCTEFCREEDGAMAGAPSKAAPPKSNNKQAQDLLAVLKEKFVNRQSIDSEEGLNAEKPYAFKTGPKILEAIVGFGLCQNNCPCTKLTEKLSTVRDDW